MRIEFLFYSECPSHETALERLKAVLEQEDVSADIEIIEVKSDEQAQELRFVGSPTILIDGEDISPLPEDAVYGLTCRAYRKEDGRISPLPPDALLRKAVRNAGLA